MKGNELRKVFLDFFKERDHRIVPSSPMIPPDDPTMLFTSAGMVQFKKFYAGEIDPLPYTRATTVQKCLRAGGKGSDLENVGRTLRHHTFFEMLGNFSFGDYFKREAIAWAWEFVTEIMKLPKDRLWVSTFYDDPEASEIWEKEQNVPSHRIVPLDEKENYWGPAGETGACGPCSEILFFMGSPEELEEASKHDRETLSRRIPEEGDLFLEIWNMVFPQFDQQPDGSRPPLKNRGIDTGAGLERMTTAMNFIETNGGIGSPYETDLLFPIVKAAAEITGLTYYRRFDKIDKNNQNMAATNRLALNAISDHARALVFALAEGMTPSNEGRGYVLRRIQRRALRFAHLLGVADPFMYQLVDPVIDVMGDAYPGIKENTDHIKKIIRLEEESFLKTLSQGEDILTELIKKTRDEGEKVIPGDRIFDLYATYGYPVDLTDEVVRDAGLSIDREGYEKAMQKHREIAKKSWKGEDRGKEAELLNDVFEKHGETLFLREEDNAPVFECSAEILALIKDEQRTESAEKGDEVAIALDQSCFYAESGGQVGDTGIIKNDNAEILITDTKKTPGGIHIHKAKVRSGKIGVGDKVTASIDQERRLSIMRNHTATHLVQAALKKVVGTHITQQGSSVTPDGFRFDFTNPEPLSPMQISEIERAVQEMILTDAPVTTREMPLEEAKNMGAIAPFGEKYGATVRVVRSGDFSLEFCGGTHCSRTGRIGTLVITNETSIASGIRRIEAKTGMGAFEEIHSARTMLNDASSSLSVKPDELTERIGKLTEEIKSLKKQMKKIRREKAAGEAGDAVGDAKEVNGIKFLTHKTENMAANELRNLADTLKAKIKQGVVVIGNTDGEKVNLVCASTDEVNKKVPAGNLIREVAKIVGGGGGGRPDMAQAGGKKPDKLDDALNAVEDIIRNMTQ